MGWQLRFRSRWAVLTGPQAIVLVSHFPDYLETLEKIVQASEFV